MNEHEHDEKSTLLVVREIAQMLRVSEVTAYRMLRDGRLPCVKLGRKTLRCRREDVDRMQQMGVGATNTTGRVVEEGRMMQENQQLLAAPRTEESTNAWLHVMSEKLGVWMLRLERELSAPPGYRLITDHGAIYLGDVNGLIVAKRFQSAVAATTGVLIRSIKQGVWEEQYAALLLKSCVDVPSDVEATVKAWFAEYFTQRTPLASRESVLSSRLPYRYDGQTYIFLSDVISWLLTINGVRKTPKELKLMLRASGCEPTVHGFRREDGRPTTRLVLMVPENLVAA